jgi:hypothetical protein
MALVGLPIAGLKAGPPAESGGSGLQAGKHCTSSGATSLARWRREPVEPMGLARELGAGVEAEEGAAGEHVELG